MKLKPLSKKGGVVTSTVMGVGGLIIGVIVILVITNTLLDAELLGTSKETITVLNEAGWINGSTYQLGGGATNTSRDTYVVSSITNATDNMVIEIANYSVGSSTGTVTNLTQFTWPTVLVNYTYLHDTDSSVQDVAEDMQSNFTSGIDNISEKIPTILLIVAVVFLFGALVLLVRNAKSMGVGGGSSL